MLFIFSEIKTEENISLLSEEYFLNIFYLQNQDSDNSFYKEINDFCKECNKISLELFSLLKSYNLYKNGELDYQYADLIEEDILVLHKPALDNYF